MKLYLPLALIILLSACNGDEPKDNPSVEGPVEPAKAAPPVSMVQVIKALPHDTASFTEGLQIHDGKLYEGAGDFVNSDLQISDLKTGKLLEKHKMGTPDVFGEGINVFKGKINQLTWKNHIVYVYDKKDIRKPIKTFSWPY